MKLYHATFKKLWNKIRKCGYLGNSPYKLYCDSKKEYVYLADEPDVAYSYAEVALDEIENERLYMMLEDDDIIMLEIDSESLDKNKLEIDQNVRLDDGEEPHTYQYEGIIPLDKIKVIQYQE